MQTGLLDKHQMAQQRVADEPYCRTLLMYDRVPRQKKHAHRFIELLFSLDGSPIVIDYDGDIRTGIGHVVGPLRRHAIVECGPVARMYVAIGMRRAAALGSLASVGVDEKDLREDLVALRGQTASAESERITLRWQSKWLPDFEGAERIEPRILTALRYIDVMEDPRTNRAAVAASVGLSPSHFSALFLREMGMPLGRYIIWRRILIALEYLKAGKTTTQAAAYAGFSDAPHLCRCYGTTFGSPPSLLPVGRIVQHGAGLEFLTQF